MLSELQRQRNEYKAVRNRLMMPPVKIKIEAASAAPQSVPIKYQTPFVTYVPRAGTLSQNRMEDRLRHLRQFMIAEEKRGQQERTMLIIDFMARRFRVSISDIMSGRRHMKAVEARHIGMYLSLMLTGASTTDVGKYFGGRDHTTIMYARKTVEKKLKENEGFAAMFATVRREVDEFLS